MSYRSAAQLLRLPPGWKVRTASSVPGAVSVSCIQVDSFPEMKLLSMVYRLYALISIAILIAFGRQHESEHGV